MSTAIHNVPAATESKTGSGLKLTPKIHPLIEEFLSSPKIFELTEALGSPLNMLFPELVGENLQSFRASMEKHKLRGRVYFAHKANRSDALARELASLQAYIDVSSINELRHALGSGFAAQRIQATGPKNREFLALSLMHDITISIDSNWELEEILKLRREFACEHATKILLRVSGFKMAHSQHSGKASRFGIPFDEVESVFNFLQDAGDNFRLLGFAFHLDTVSVAEKAFAIEACLELFEDSLDRGFDPHVLNLGGGFKVNYLANAQDWHAYTLALRESVIGSRAPITWQNNSFGLLPDKGSLRGTFNTYSYYDSVTGASFLEEMLAHEVANRGDAQVSSVLRDNGIEVWIEPGRSMLDQTGITVARVNSLRKSSQGETMVCLNMKRQDLCFLDQEMFVDPIVLSQHPEPQSEPDSAHPVYFAGNLCLESDLICRHQTFLPALPKPGDLVVFINTAGYFMDFSASQSIMQLSARKVAIFKRNGQFAWTADDQYYPWLSKA